MRGVLSGNKVIVTGVEAGSSEFRGYGRKEESDVDKERESKVTLSLEEAAFLLEAGKIELKKETGTTVTFEEFLKHALSIFSNFGARYTAYKDLKERGYVVKPGGVDFWLYPRGPKQEGKHARYFIRILSEEEFLPLKELQELLVLGHNMRKEPIIAVADDESDVTYYKVKEAKFEMVAPRSGKAGGIRESRSTNAVFLFGDKVILWDAVLAENLYTSAFYGKLTKESRLLLSLVEAAYLIKKGLLDLRFEQFIERASSIESDFMAKYTIYEDLREKGLIVKTGFKFGSHFRVYKTVEQKHSLDLVHVLPEEHVFPMSELARAVRLAHGVKKRMVFSFTEEIGVKSRINYIDVGRMKL